MNAPTAPYRPVAPSARDAAPYIPWLIDKAVRLGRDNGYADLVDPALGMILGDLGVTAPIGGFVDSDGRNARGRTAGRFDADGYDADGYNQNGYDRAGFNREGVNRNGEDREDVVATMVDGWDAETAAAVLAQLATRVA